MDHDATAGQLVALEVGEGQAAQIAALLEELGERHADADDGDVELQDVDLEDLENGQKVTYQIVGLDEADQEVVYYTSLLAWVGCHVDAYEQAKWFGDEMALKSDFRHTDFGLAGARPLFILRHLGAGRPMAERVKLGVTFPGDGRRVAEAMIENHWLAADGLGERPHRSSARRNAGSAAAIAGTPARVRASSD